MIIRKQLRRLAAWVLLTGGAAFAQTPGPAPTPTTLLDSVPEKIAPSAKPTAPVLSNGVVHPKEVDPAIGKPAPKVLDPNVVPPRGASPAPQSQ